MAGEGDTANDGDTSTAGGSATGLTEDRVIELIKTVGGKAVNTAIGERFKAFESKQKKAQDEFQETLARSVTEAVTEVVTGAVESKLDEMGVKPQSGGSAKGGSVDEDAIKNSPFVKGLLKREEERDRELKTLREQRESERKTARSEKLRSRLLSELTDQGLDPKRVNDAVDLLLFRNRARYESDESESIVFKDASGDDVDLKSGITEWAKSEDGKLYLPPSGASGSGSTPERRAAVRTQNGAPDRESLKTSLAAAYRGELT